MSKDSHKSMHTPFEELFAELTPCGANMNEPEYVNNVEVCSVLCISVKRFEIFLYLF